MTTDGLGVGLYLAAGVLFIRSLAGLSKQETALAGNIYGIIGMTVSVAVALFLWVFDSPLNTRMDGLSALVVASATGATVGFFLARRVEMTGMPELVAVLHSFVGLAAVLVGMSSYLAPRHDVGVALLTTVHQTEVWIGVAVGAITLTGSIVAWGKLKGVFSGKPLLLPGRHVLNAAIALTVVGLAIPFIAAPGVQGFMYLVIMTGLSGLLGIHLVLAIGGADMPVVVSLLNSYSGWAAAAAGFMLGNDLLIVTGALVGSSGTILSIIMTRAMNRSILSVVFGGFGTDDVKPVASALPAGTVHQIQVEELATKLKRAKRVIIVPGYGMAVSRAQAAVKALTLAFEKRGVNVRFAIHPVAGRLPGHMNVLLAEAGVPYEKVLEMDQINQDFPTTDVVLVIGANDIVNPAALSDKSSSIYGMPVLEVWKARMVVVLKRGMAAGYAGVENPLFYLENSRMLFGDARVTAEALVKAIG